VSGGNLVKSFTAFGLEGFPLIAAGDDLASIIVETARKDGLELEDGDVIVAAQKIFSKAEGRVVKLRNVVASSRAQELASTVGKDPRFLELVLRETKRVLKASPDILLVEDVRGLVCINAGIDKSNVQGRGEFALLPEDSGRSAEECRARIRRLTGKNVGVVICDTFSRPFRRGQANFAIGTAGMKLFKDYRGKKDLFGRVLKVKNVAVVDELAAAAELLMGQAEEAVPVVVFKKLGHLLEFDGKHNMADLFISEEEDLFRGVL
jgi:coenzyme F420-0:L-glutamate ligase/coenzyme F420-1:gamma-L-glutamate ligase